MFSGKTTELLRKYERYQLAQRKCIFIKYNKDNRYENGQITHNGLKVNAFPYDKLADSDNIVQGYDIVCIDEIQFYPDAPEYCDKWANEGKIVVACGLNGKFDRTQWDVISDLIPLVEDITYLTAICLDNGNQATYSKRLTDDTRAEVVGGKDMYQAVDRETYFKTT
jgi:thymidine kinase